MMRQGQVSEIFDRIIEIASNNKGSELEKIEHLLKGAIAEVEPRRDFRKGLAERLAHQAEEKPVEVESFRGKKISADFQPPSSLDLPMLATGLVGGMVLIVMGVRLLLFIRSRSRSF